MELPSGNGEPKSGSIAVSGWALDDMEVVSVKIYRLEGDSKVYIGDAVFVEGARPDVEQAYPGYPHNNRAGWGYLLLTNMLPNGGNGYFALRAIAGDSRGHQTILGTKTIFCDNAYAVKPFGAIDTPGQGGTASGEAYINFGWALPAYFNFIPTDGSTIIVWVDGVPVGHPVYNRYRQDIAALFPDYNNSNGAGGYFYLDTTQYENGLHTIAWSVTDEVGNTGGIGSRYFNIQNTWQRAGRAAKSAGRTAQSLPGAAPDISKIPVDYSRPVAVMKGYQPDGPPQTCYPDEKGVIYIRLKELQRVEIHLGEMGGPGLTGFQVMGSRLRSLPIGSFLDSETGIFSWSPGPGHYGLYTLLFLEKMASGEVFKNYIQIRILAEYQ